MRGSSFYSGAEVCRARACSSPPIRPLQRGIDDLVLPDARDAAELLADDGGGVVVAVARQILDGHARVGQGGLDQRLDLAGRHRHAVDPLGFSRMASIQAGKKRSCAVAQRLDRYGSAIGQCQILPAAVADAHGRHARPPRRRRMMAAESATAST